jgi:tetratricopeptide (TPR) repeat protein
LDPLSNDANGYLATTLYWARRYDEALQQARKVIEFDPTFTPGHVGMCWILTAQRRLPEARAACEKGFAQDPSPWTTLALARVNALAGNRTAAEQAIRGLQDRPEQLFPATIWQWFMRRWIKRRKRSPRSRTRTVGTPSGLDI